jgi:hypothetical protein
MEHLNEPFFRKYYAKNAKASFGGKACHFLWKYPSIQTIALHIKLDMSSYHWMIMQMKDASEEALSALFMIALEYRWDHIALVPLSIQQRALDWWDKHGPNSTSPK